MNRLFKIAKSSLILLVFIALATISNAQSKDRSKPTRLESKEISDSIRGVSENEYFYRFAATPGEIVVTLSVETGQDSPVNGVTFVLSGENGETLTHGAVMAFRGRTAQAEKRVILKQRQSSILLRIYVIGGGSGKYRLSLDGSVYFGNLGDISTGSGSENAASNSQARASWSTQNQSSPLTLDGTLWTWQEQGIYFFPVDKPGIVIFWIPGETMNIRMEGVRTDYIPVGTFKQKGNSARLDFSDHYIVATIKGNIMEGEITYKKSNQKSKWLVQRGSWNLEQSGRKASTQSSDTDRENISAQLTMIERLPERLAQFKTNRVSHYCSNPADIVEFRGTGGSVGTVGGYGDVTKLIEKTEVPAGGCAKDEFETVSAIYRSPVANDSVTESSLAAFGWARKYENSAKATEAMMNDIVSSSSEIVKREPVKNRFGQTVGGLVVVQEKEGPELVMFTFGLYYYQVVSVNRGDAQKVQRLLPLE